MSAASPLDVFSCRLDETALIEASAGTGKTWAICGLVLRLYRNGLREPLRFYPRSSWAFVASLGEIEKARAKWESEFDPSLAEGNDPAYRVALRGCADPLAGAFGAVAVEVFDPLREAAEEEPVR